VGWKNDLSDACGGADRIARKGGLFGEDVALRTEACAVVEVVSAVVKQAPFHDVMGIGRWCMADYTLDGVSLEYGVAEVVSSEQLHVFG